jgi:muconolactone delta-isomerase
MLYLVQFEYPEPGPVHPPSKVVDMVERAIAPSLDAVVELEKEGKIRAAGVVAGAKSSAMIVDVADHNELSGLLQSLPFWSIMKVTVTPLQSFAERANQEKRAVEFLRSPAAEGIMSAW